MPKKPRMKKPKQYRNSSSCDRSLAENPQPIDAVLGIVARLPLVAGHHDDLGSSRNVLNDASNPGPLGAAHMIPTSTVR